MKINPKTTVIVITHIDNISSEIAKDINRYLVELNRLNYSVINTYTLALMVGDYSRATTFIYYTYTQNNNENHGKI